MNYPVTISSLYSLTIASKKTYIYVSDDNFPSLTISKKALHISVRDSTSFILCNDFLKNSILLSSSNNLTKDSSA